MYQKLSGQIQGPSNKPIREVEPDPTEMAAQYGAATPVPEWQAAGLLAVRQPRRRLCRERNPADQDGAR